MYPIVPVLYNTFNTQVSKTIVYVSFRPADCPATVPAITLRQNISVN